jgi:putative salt-induced outer membrane protein YdiY
MMLLALVIPAAAAKEQIQLRWPDDSPMPKRYDWVKLSSGEWLNGKIKVLYDRELEFKSEELGTQTIDWEDVEEIRSYQVISIRFEGGTERTGRIHLKEGYVQFDQQELVYPVSTIVSMAAGEPIELNFWNIEVGLGAGTRFGNQDEEAYQLSLELQRRTNLSEMNYEYIGFYHKANSRTSANDHRLFSTFEWFISHRLFWEVYSLELQIDQVENLKLRAVLGSGLGYHLIDTELTTWDLTLSPAIEYIEYDSVEPGEDDKVRSPALVFESDWEHELTDDLDLFQRHRASLMDDKSGFYHHYSETGFEAELVDDLELEFSLLWERTQRTLEDENGNKPERDDFRLIIKLNYEFP